MQARVRAQTSSLCMCTVPNWCRAKSCSPDLDVTRTHAFGHCAGSSLCRLGLQAARALLSGPREPLSKRAGCWSDGWPHGLLRTF